MVKWASFAKARGEEFMWQSYRIQDNPFYTVINAYQTVDKRIVVVWDNLHRSKEPIMPIKMRS